jgi:hypothetical protein
MARIAYRKEFDQQLRWSSLQALEKYFKAILLYNRVSAKGVGHNLVRAVYRLKSIPDLEFGFPSSEAEEFVEYLSEYGEDRYLSHPTHLKDDALSTLDKTVWSVRRYCFFMRQVISKDGGEVDLFEENKRKALHPYYEKNPHKFRITDGQLENILKNRKPAYHDLVWKNFYFGRTKKRKVRNFRFRMSFEKPTHSLNPEFFETLDELVDFPKPITSNSENWMVSF